MNSPRGDVLIAVLLVIAGQLGFIARALTGTPLFGLMGLIGFVLAAAVLIGTAINAIRAGLDAPYQPPTHGQDRASKSVTLD